MSEVVTATSQADEGQGQGQPQPKSTTQGQSKSEIAAKILRRHGQEVQELDTASSQPQTEQPESQPAESSSQGAQSTAAEPTVVTEELAQEYPDMKLFVGKPLTDYYRSISEQRKHLARVEQDNAFLRRQVEIMSHQQEAQPQKTTQPDTVEVGKMPDPLEDKAGFEKWLADRDAAMEQRLMSKVEPIAKPVHDMEQARMRDQILTALKAKLPDGVTPEDAIRAFGAARKDLWTPKLDEFYGNNPSVLVQDVVDFARAIHLEEELKAAEITHKNELTHRAADLSRKAADSKEPTPSVTAATRENQSAKLSPTMQKIVERNLPKFRGAANG